MIPSATISPAVTRFCSKCIKKVRIPTKRSSTLRKGRIFLARILILGLIFSGLGVSLSTAQIPPEKTRNRSPKNLVDKNRNRPPSNPDKDIIPNRYIVVLKDEVQDSEFVTLDMAGFYGLTAEHRYTKAIKGFAASISPEMLAYVENDPDVAFVEPDRLIYPVAQTIPTGVRRIRADQNPTAKIDGIDDRVNVDVAIIDTGIDPDHSDLNVFRSVNCTSGSCTTGGDDAHGHGTHVGGTVGALDNNIGVVGVAPGARLWSLKVFRDNGSGTVSMVIAAMDYVTSNASQIEVANLSLSWTGNSNAARQAFQSAVAGGVVIVAAAGNQSDDVYGGDGFFGTSDDHQPAAFPEVLAVSAMSDRDGIPGSDSFASFSNYSRRVVSGNPVSSPGAAIDLLMPGKSIRSTYKGNSYATLSGTSMASPHAAGLAALYIAANGRASSAAGVYAIRQALIDGGEPQDGPNGLSTRNDPDANWENIGWAGGASGPVDTPPSVVITSPAKGATVFDMVEVTANATDDDGIDEVEFFVDGVSLGVDTNGADGWSVSWDTNSTTDGESSITTTATDTSGQTASDTITVLVDNIDDPPTVAITDPREGATVSGDISVAADAFDDDGITQVEFFVDGVSIGVDTNSFNGWSMTWHTEFMADGDYPLTATATDKGGQTTSDTIMVRVENALSAGDMHVADLDGSSSDYSSRGLRWNATVTVTVHDADENPVSGATVTGTWSYRYWRTESCTTNSAGTCSMTRTRIYGRRYPTVDFTVENVERSGMTYGPGANHEPDGDSDGTTITISNP